MQKKSNHIRTITQHKSTSCSKLITSDRSVDLSLETILIVNRVYYIFYMSGFKWGSKMSFKKLLKTNLTFPFIF